jgi:hypothetical protein
LTQAVARERNQTRRKKRRDHPVEGLDCGREKLNRYLLRYAWQNQEAGATQTYVCIAGEVVVGYHTLAVGAPDRLKKGLAKHLKFYCYWQFGNLSEASHVAQLNLKFVS